MQLSALDGSRGYMRQAWLRRSACKQKHRTTATVVGSSLQNATNDVFSFSQHVENTFFRVLGGTRTRSSAGWRSGWSCGRTTM